MLGRYANFPEIIHGIAHFTYEGSERKVQQGLLSAFFRLSQKRYPLGEMACFSSQSCEVNFEFGIGEDFTFTFLDKDELQLLKTEIERKALSFLDFLCVLKHRVVDEAGNRSPLRFDYFVLRFAFERNRFQLLVFHERGPQHVHVEELIAFLRDRIESELADHYAITPRFNGIRTV